MTATDFSFHPVHGYMYHVRVTGTICDTARSSLRNSISHTLFKGIIVQTGRQPALCLTNRQTRGKVADESGGWFAERKRFGCESRFGGSTCELVWGTGTDWRMAESFGKVVFPAGSAGRFDERRLSHRSHSAVLLFAIPRVFLPDDDLFLTYTSLGTPPLGHWTSLELEITSSWKPISRTDRGKGTGNTQNENDVLLFHRSPLRQQGIYVYVIFMKSRYRENKHRC